MALVVLLGAILWGGAAMAQATRHPAENADPQPGPPGEPPYEMAGRAEERAPVCDWQDLSGWVVEGWEAEGWLYRSRARKLYQREFSGKLVYRALGPIPALLVRPARPTPIPEPWDAVNLWTWGNNWGWVPDSSTPPLQASAVVRDATGAELEIPLGGIDYQYWFLMNGRLSAEQRARVRRPLEFVGLRFTNGTNRELRTVYLGPLYFFQEQWAPLSFRSWPEKLPFPTRPETILPTSKAADFRNEVRQEGAETVFRYAGPDCGLEYRYQPREGGLGDIALRYQGRTMRPLAGGGARLAGAAGGTADAKLLSAQLAGDTLTVRWLLSQGNASTELAYRLRMLQKSLVIEMEATQPVVEAIALGRAEPVKEAKLFRIPYLTYGGNDPHVLYADGLFLFAQFDWYHSDASVLVGRGARGPGWAVYNGEAQYLPKTDGGRNLIRERLFLTASPDVQEVLPTIPNPASPFREVQGERLWRVRFGADYQGELEDAARLRRYGCDRVTVRYHEETWRDAGESFTFRTQAAPGKGGDEALRRFVAAVKGLGWRVGLYTNYTDYAPVNSFWNEDWVLRLPNGDWARAWPRCYAPKPMVAVEMEEKLAPQIQAKFGENHSYCDVHTCVTPFSRVDYDHRVPGAGTFRRTFECFGRLLYHEKAAHQGPVYSEGTNHWWYAGLTDGNYAQLNHPAPPTVPLLVDFDLLKMHPLEMDAGMGAPDMFFRGAPWNLDQFIASTLAYGHIGFLEWSDLAGTLKVYYMMQQAQARYAMVPVARIEYEHEGRLVDTSRALVTDAYRRNRVHVVYQNGTEVYVNGSPDAWPVQAAERDWLLPEWGYLVLRDDGLLVYSALVSAAGPQQSRGPRQRVDVSQGTGQHYADSRGGFAFLGRLAVEGSAALKKEANAWWLIPTPECRDFAFSPALAGFSERREVVAQAVDEDGSPAPAPVLRWSRGLLHIIPTSGKALKYQVRPGRRARPAELVAESTLAVLGQAVEVQVPAAAQAGRAFWELDGERMPVEGTIAGDRLACPVPSGARPGQHLWLGVPSASGELWVDFVAAEPCEASIALPSGLTLGQGQPAPVRVEVTNNLLAEARAAVSLTVKGGGPCEPERAEVRLAPGERRAVEFRAPLPWEEGRWELAAVADCTGRASAAVLSLRTAFSRPVVLDLADSGATSVWGYALRGREEAVGAMSGYDGSFFPTTDSSGGVARRSLFAHPPWGEGRAGYVFALYDVDLPGERPLALEFWMGIRDGYQTTDGVIYRVVVTDGMGQASEVFAENYRAHEWRPAKVDLSRFAGQKVTLKLITDCGANDDTTSDHALWGEPRVVVDETRLRVELSQGGT